MKKKLLSPVNDHVFKRVFGKHLRVLAGFLSAVLEMPLDAADIRVLDPNFRAERDDDKLGVLDVKVETRNGLIDVEVQVQPHLHLKKRLLYYTSRMFVEQIDKGQNYGKLTSLALDPIEKKPLRRFRPRSLILSVGSFGCKGYDTFGPFKLVGGICKGHPDETDLKNACRFLDGLMKTAEN